MKVERSYPISLQLRPATNPYLGSVTLLAAAARVLTAFVRVVLRVPVMLAENWLTEVVAVDVRLTIGEKALLLMR